MRILIIDDGRVIRGLDGHSVTYARGLTTGRELLFDQGGWDEVWLDHDLGYEGWNEETHQPIEETIRPLVREITQRLCDAIEDKPDREPEALVHTFVVITDNPAGRRWITDELSAVWPVRQERPACTFDWDAKANERAAREG